MEGAFLAYQVCIRWREHSLLTRCALGGGSIPCLPGVHWAEGAFLAYQVCIRRREHSLLTRCALGGGSIPCLPGVH